MAANSGPDKGTRNLVIAMVAFIVAVGIIFSFISNRASQILQFPQLYLRLMAMELF